MLKAPDHQVAGHFAADGQLGPLIDGGGLFFKPLQSTDRGQTELSFYTSLSSSPLPSRISRFFPSFHGTRLLPSAAGEGAASHPHLVLEDLTADFSSPSIIDLKIGSRTWAPSDPKPYFDKCIAKDRQTTSLSLAFRVSGLKIRSLKPTRGEVKRFSIADVRRVLKQFVSDRDLDLELANEVYKAEGGVLEQLMELKGWFEEQTRYHFYSASVMLMFERGKGKARVKMVDFAHVVDGGGVIDHNFLGGLCSLIRFVKEVVDEKEKKAANLENGE